MLTSAPCPSAHLARRKVRHTTMIQLTCSHCQTKLSVSDDKAGHNRQCPKCGHTIHVPGIAKGHAALMPQTKAREKVDEGEIPLADESPRARASEPARPQQPRRPGSGQVIMPAHAGEGIDRAEIPLTLEPEEKEKKTPPQQA